MIIGINLIQAGLVNGYSLDYYDCTKPTTVDSFNLLDGCVPPTQAEVEPKQYTILQKLKTSLIDAIHCTATISEFVYYCGAFSHLKLYRPHKISRVLPIDPLSCAHAADTGIFVTPGGQQHKITVGVLSQFSINPTGTINIDGSAVSCQAEQVHEEEGVLEELVVKDISLMVERVKLTIHHRTGYVESNNDRTRLPCKGDRGYCRMVRSTYVWSAAHFSTNCPYRGVRAVMMTAVPGQTYLVDPARQVLLKKTDSRTLSAPCPDGTVISSTQHSTIFLTETPLDQFTAIDTELDLILLLQVKANFEMYLMEQALSKFRTSYSRDMCHNQFNQRKHNELFRVPGQPAGVFALIRGQVLYTLSCPVHQAELRPHKGHCTIEIPAKSVNSTTAELMHDIYIDPFLYTLTSSPQTTICSEYFPMQFKAAGNWLTVSYGSVQRTQAPPALPGFNSTTFTHTSLVGKDSSIYSDAEIADLTDILEFGHFSKGLLSRTTYGSCRQQGKSGCTDNRAGDSSSNIDNYDLYTVTRLAEIAENAAEKPFKTVYEKFKSFVNEYGIWISLIVIFGWLLQLLAMLIMLSISIVKSGAKSASTFCVAFLCFWPLTLSRELARARPGGLKAGGAGSAQELSPLRYRRATPKCSTCDPTQVPMPGCPNPH